MSINLKYSKSVVKDYKKLSEGRKKYIKERADKNLLDVESYLKLKYGVNDE